jgi:hypothetical protein
MHFGKLATATVPPLLCISGMALVLEIAVALSGAESLAERCGAGSHAWPLHVASMAGMIAGALLAAMLGTVSDVRHFCWLSAGGAAGMLLPHAPLPTLVILAHPGMIAPWLLLAMLPGMMAGHLIAGQAFRLSRLNAQPVGKERIWS